MNVFFQNFYLFLFLTIYQLMVDLHCLFRSGCLSVYLHLSFVSVSLSVCCLSVYLPCFCLSVYLPSVGLAVCVSIFPSVFGRSIWLFLSLSICLSTSVCQSGCLSIHFYIFLFFSVGLSSVYPPVCLSVCLC